MTRQRSVIRKSYDWLGHCISSYGIDQRLVAHIKLWEILHDVIDQMGSDVHVPLDQQSLTLEEHFTNQLKRWLDESQLRIAWCLSSQHLTSATT